MSNVPFSIVPVIMSGGAGTRLWPLSTPETPKQFHALFGEHSLLTETLLRFRHPGFLPPMIIGAEPDRLHLLAAAKAACGTDFHLLMEPMGRNTAFTAAVAAVWAAQEAPEATVLLSPADHLVGAGAEFANLVQQAAQVAQDHIVTFGMAPTRPETGYGYIRQGADLAAGAFVVDRFLEKPDQKTAQSLLDQGGHVWNAGVFLFAPQVMLSELEAHAPDILAAARAAYAQRTGKVLDAEATAQAPKAPIDTAVMEKTRRAAVVPADVGWADVGSFDEIWRLSAKDDQGNVALGPVVATDCQNCLLIAAEKPLAVTGLADQIVVSTPAGTVTLPRGQSQAIKDLRQAALALVSD